MYLHLTVTVLLTAAMLVGCGREEPKPTAVIKAAVTSGAVEDATAKAAVDTKVAADAEVAADMKPADAKIAAGLEAAEVAKADADQAAPDAKADADLKTADAAKASSDQTTTEATSLLAQVQQYIKDNKIDLAEKTIDKLDGMKGSLPASLQTQIETAQAALKAKKAVGMLSK